MLSYLLRLDIGHCYIPLIQASSFYECYVDNLDNYLCDLTSISRFLLM